MESHEIHEFMDMEHPGHFSQFQFRSHDTSRRETKMHGLDLAGLATLFVKSSTVSLMGRAVPLRSKQQNYWLECKFRHDYWSGQLRQHRQNLQQKKRTQLRQCWLQILPIMEEILITEPIARCVAYHARLLESLKLEQDFSTLANSVLASHVEARHRCLHLLVFGESMAASHFDSLNHVRRDMEAFTDSLLACMIHRDSVDAFCFDRFRTSQITQELHLSKQISPAWLDTVSLLLDSLRYSMRRTVTGHITSSVSWTVFNQKIGSALLGLVPAEAYDSLGCLKSIHFGRMSGESPESQLTETWQDFFVENSTTHHHYPSRISCS